MHDVSLENVDQQVPILDLKCWIKESKSKSRNLKFKNSIFKVPHQKPKLDEEENCKRISRLKSDKKTHFFAVRRLGVTHRHLKKSFTLRCNNR